MSKDGGPAFPQSKWDNALKEYFNAGGMSLRDWFAGQALPHSCARARYELDKYGDRGALSHAPKAAALAYEIADAMLKARAGGGND